MGGWHCGGMCGGIAALATKPRAAFLYQLGRLFSYSLLGVLFSLFGAQMTGWLPEEKKIFVALFLGLFSYWILISSWNLKIPKQIQTYLWKHRLRGSFVSEYLCLGVLNGLLPCTWLYAFLMVAVGLSNPFRAFILMFCLWLGSLPWLIGFSFLGQQIRRHLNQSPWVARILLLSVLFSLLAHNLSEGHLHF
jgi:sulfite exporter TauE/SafE